MKLTQKDREIIRDLSRTTYDSIVLPPPLSSLEHILKSRPRSFVTINLDDLASSIVTNFFKSEPLINKLSKENLNQLNSSIKISFNGTNFVDIEEGGNGLIVPTFMEIMHRYILWVKHDNCVALVTKQDHDFYHKYFWCFEEYAKLTYSQMNKAS